MPIAPQRALQQAGWQQPPPHQGQPATAPHRGWGPVWKDTEVREVPGTPNILDPRGGASGPRYLEWISPSLAIPVPPFQPGQRSNTTVLLLFVPSGAGREKLQSWDLRTLYILSYAAPSLSSCFILHLCPLCPSSGSSGASAVAALPCGLLPRWPGSQGGHAGWRRGQHLADLHLTSVFHLEEGRSCLRPDFSPVHQPSPSFNQLASRSTWTQ